MYIQGGAGDIRKFGKPYGKMEWTKTLEILSEKSEKVEKKKKN